MPLDQAGLKQQGLLFRGREDGLQPPHLGQHDRSLGVLRTGGAGVLRQPPPQVLGLAHIEHLLPPAQQQIHSSPLADSLQRGGGQRLGLVFRHTTSAGQPKPWQRRRGRRLLLRLAADVDHLAHGPFTEPLALGRLAFDQVLVKVDLQRIAPRSG